MKQNFFVAFYFFTARTSWLFTVTGWSGTVLCRLGFFQNFALYFVVVLTSCFLSALFMWRSTENWDILPWKTPLTVWHYINKDTQLELYMGKKNICSSFNIAIFLYQLIFTKQHDWSIWKIYEGDWLKDVVESQNSK